MGTQEIIEALHTKWAIGPHNMEYLPAWADDTLAYAERNLTEYELKRIERLALSLV
jgi:hypothetical protein